MTSILTLISFLSPLAALVLGWRQRFTLLWIYAMVGLIIDNGGELLKNMGYDQHFLGNIFVLVQFLLFSIYCQRVISKNRRIYYFAISIVAAAFVVHTIWNSVTILNFTGASVLCVIYIIYGVLGYMSILKNTTVVSLTDSSLFWINTAIFLYGAATCILFLFITYLKSEALDFLMKIWFNFFTVVNILHYIFIGIGLYKTRKVGA